MGYELVSGDTGSKLVRTCRDNTTKQPLDLTGKTVQLRYKIDGGGLIVRAMVVQAPATAGKAEYQFGSSDLPLVGTRGTLQGEIRINPGLPDQLTSVLPFSISVRAALS